MGQAKTPEQVNIMRKIGKILGNILKELEAEIAPGIDIFSLEEKFLDLCRLNNVNPSCKGYRPYFFPPFPTGLCVSINDQSVHCFPKRGVILQEGYVINVDTVIEQSGLHVDSSFAKFVTSNSSQPKQEAETIKQRLVKVSQEALHKAIHEVKEHKKVGDISYAMQKYVESQGFNVLVDFAGHGIGTDMHEDPEIPCYGLKNTGPKLKAGMTICIESLICSGSPEVKSTSSWETKMRDGGYFAQFEHTILVKPDSYEIITLSD